MKITAVIAEFNPLHKGHAYLLSKAKENADGLLVLMSGSCVQRGNFALLNKWFRTHTALINGADLVCELPYVVSAQSAEYFASGSIKILNALNCCSDLAFGSEHGNITQLNHVAQLLANETPAFKTLLKGYLNQHYSYARARQETLASILGMQDAALLETPNNILAIEYLKAILQSNSLIKPKTFLRKGQSYHGDGQGLLSATSIRHYFEEDDFSNKDLTASLPYSTALLMQEKKRQIAHPLASFYTTIRTQLLTTAFDELLLLPDAEKGLLFKMIKMAKVCNHYPEFIEAVSSKSCPKTRVQRLLMNMVMQCHKNDIETFRSPSFTPWLRVLGFNTKGQALLKQLKTSTDLPILTNIRSNQTRLSPEQRHLFQFDLLSTDLRSLYCDLDPEIGSDYTHKIRRINEFKLYSAFS